MQKLRLAYLDYLRGILAFAVMIYHFTVWNSIPWPGEIGTFIKKTGPLAVSGFYIISGYSIAYVYFRNRLSLPFLFSFATKRFFRLAPLLWLAILLSYWIGYEFSAKTLFLNATLLFGFVAHDRYIATGSWSIGNEIVFYALFPLLMMFQKPSAAKIWCAAVLGASLLFAVWSAFSWIPAADSESVHWSRYIHPANQFWLFAAGVFLCLYRETAIPSRYVYSVGLIAFLAFVVLPASGNSVYEGWPRIVLCLLLVVIVWTCGLLQFDIPQWVARPLHLLGAWSYSVYLLHPVANHVVMKANEAFIHISPAIASIALAIPLSLVMSALAYSYVEQVGMKAGKNLASRFAH
jgi:exopolysaccharide production protein ExoZ